MNAGLPYDLQDAMIELHEGNMKKAADERTSLRNQLQVARAQLERLEQQAETAKQTVLSLEKQLSAVRKVSPVCYSDENSTCLPEKRVPVSVPLTAAC